MTSSLNTYQWFIKNDFSTYAGKWIAIINEKVVASGENVEEVLTKVSKEHPNKKPFLTRITDKLSIL